MFNTYTEKIENFMPSLFGKEAATKHVQKATLFFFLQVISSSYLSAPDVGEWSELQTSSSRKLGTHLQRSPELETLSHYLLITEFAGVIGVLCVVPGLASVNFCPHI